MNKANRLKSYVNQSTLDGNKNILKRANEKFMDGDYLEAIAGYEEFENIYGKEKNVVKINKEIARKRVNFNNANIVVSVLCVSYNHENYIGDALSAILSQKTEFKFEIIVGDDASTDSTQNIISEYAKKHPGVIVPVLREKNIGPVENFLDIFIRARGHFISICDGDDYFIDDKKLQSQVEILRGNSSLSACFHKVKVVQNNEKNFIEYFPSLNEFKTFTKKDFVEGNFLSSVSVMYRKSALDKRLKKINKNAFPLDHYLHYLASDYGDFYYVPDVMAVYRRNSQGVFSSHNDGNGILRKWGCNHIHLYNEFLKGCKPEQRAVLELKIKYVLDFLLLEYIDDCDFGNLDELHAQFPDLVESYFEYNFNVPKPTSFVLLKDGSYSNYLKCTNTIDVIVTAYNHEQTISSCIRSVIEQIGFFKLRIIVSNDSSLDATQDIIDKEFGSIPFVEIYHQSQNLGLQSNLKFCIKKLNSRFVSFCEGDDKWLSKYRLNKLLFCALKDKDIGIVFNWVLLNINNKYLLPHEGQSLIKEQVNHEDLLFDNLIANFSCCFYRTEAVRSVDDNYFSFNNSSDWTFNLLVSKHFKVAFFKEILSEYYINPKGLWTSLSNSEKQESIASVVRDFVSISGCKSPLSPEINLSEVSTSTNFIQSITYENGLLAICGWVFNESVTQAKFSIKTLVLVCQGKTVCLTNSQSFVRDDVSRAYPRIRKYSVLFSGFDVSCSVALNLGVIYNVYCSMGDLNKSVTTKLLSFTYDGAGICVI